MHVFCNLIYTSMLQAMWSLYSCFWHHCKCWIVFWNFSPLLPLIYIYIYIFGLFVKHFSLPIYSSSTAFLDFLIWAKFKVVLWFLIRVTYQFSFSPPTYLMYLSNLVCSHQILPFGILYQSFFNLTLLK